MQSLIAPMKYELVKSAIASLVATERNNQLALAASGGYTQEQIDNNFDFNVFKDMFAFPDASQLPCVNFTNADGDFDPGKDYTDSKWHTFRLAIDCYSISCAEPGSDADELAAARLDYLWSQVFLILNAEENWCKGLTNIVSRTKFTSWSQKIVKFGAEETAETVLAIQAILELQFEEPTERVQGEDLEMLVESMEIDEQFISPFITNLIT